MSAIIDLTGKTFGRLVVSSFYGKVGGHTSWWCNCSCGTVKVIRGSHLKSGESASCGCMVIAAVKTHGLSRSPEYKAWVAMIQRCTNANAPGYEDYGDRGIRVCSRWLKSFSAFYEDVGPRPAGMSLDRKNNNLHYTPRNCRWTTDIIQANNTRANRWISFRGKHQTVAMWARELGIKPDTIRTRLFRGWSDQDALARNGFPPADVVTGQLLFA